MARIFSLSKINVEITRMSLCGTFLMRGQAGWGVVKYLVYHLSVSFSLSLSLSSVSLLFHTYGIYVSACCSLPYIYYIYTCLIVYNIYIAIYTIYIY